MLDVLNIELFTNHIQDQHNAVCVVNCFWAFSIKDIIAQLVEKTCILLALISAKIFAANQQTVHWFTEAILTAQLTS